MATPMTGDSMSFAGISPRNRHLAPDAVAIKQFDGAKTWKLKRTLRTLNERLDDAHGQVESQRDTAPIASSREALILDRHNAALIGRVLELRREGTLEEPVTDGTQGSHCRDYGSDTDELHRTPKQDLRGRLEVLDRALDEEFPTIRRRRRTRLSPGDLRRLITQKESILNSRRNKRTKQGPAEVSTSVQSAKESLQQSPEGQNEFSGRDVDAVVARLKQELTDEVQGAQIDSRDTSLDTLRRQLERDATSDDASAPPVATRPDEDSNSLSEESPTRVRMPTFASSSDPAPPHSHMPRFQSLTIAEKVREANERSKWGLAGSDWNAIDDQSVSPDAFVNMSVSRSAGGGTSKLNLSDLRNNLDSLLQKRDRTVTDQETIRSLKQSIDMQTKSGAAVNDKAEKRKPPTKPTMPGGRKRRRSLRAEKEPKDANTARPSATSTNGDDGHEDDDGEHKSLWKVMQDAKAGSDASTAPAPQIEEKATPEETAAPPPDLPDDAPPAIASIKAADLHIDALKIPQPPVPGLEYGLDRVLFNPGVYQLQDPTSRVYNFDPYLQDIMPAMEFDFNALKEYKTSSEDKALATIAKDYQKKYIGSTSSMTSTLGHFHYLLSNWRALNLDMLSRGFPDKREDVTRINRAPNAIFLRWKPESGTYAIDADKEFDGANVLMMLGKSMEKMLTLPTSDFEKYRKSDPREVPQEAKEEPEAFQYTTMGDFLMRSQLDAYDSRLPGTGMFDLKTRAVLSVRMDADDFEPMLGYEIHTLQGKFNSYEREHYDMMRSTMLKYMLQARMGRMQGIFAAYHNIERIFGFEYIPIMNMDRALHGQIDPCLGDQEFKLSLKMLNEVLNKATAKFPEKSLRIHFETTKQNLGGENSTPVMAVFAEPMDEKDINEIQNTSKDKVREFERTMMGIEDKPTEPAPGTQAPTEYPPTTPKPESEEQPEPGLSNGEEGEDQAPTDYPPATPEGGSKEAAEDQAPTEYPPATPKPALETPASTEPPPEEDSTPTTYPPSTPEPPSASSSNSDFTSSTSSADPSFLSSLSSRTSNDKSPLFSATLMTKSRVNGEPVPRPVHLKPEDDWTVEYLLTEYPESEATWARYNAMKARRKEVFSKERDEDDDLPLDESSEEGKEAARIKKKSEDYITFLRELAQKGRKFRAEVDEAEKGREKRFAWKGSGSVATAETGMPSAVEVTESVEDVGGYMGWLYGERGRKM